MPGKQAPALDDTFLGRFIGVQATGKGKYRVLLLDTIGNDVVRVEDLSNTPAGLLDYQAFAQVVYSLATHLRPVLPRLSRLNPLFQSDAEHGAAIRSFKDAVRILTAHGVARKAMDLSESIIDGYLKKLGHPGLSPEKKEAA